MEKKNDKYSINIMRVFGVLLCCSIFMPSCSSVKFGVSRLEDTGDARALLALCYRAQKDNAASGGGNTRNCDDVQAEAIRYVRNETCQLAYDKKKCVCVIYKICEKTETSD